MKNKLAFTLIELLITIAILGIIAAIIVQSLLGQQKDARDAKRKSDLQQAKSALESAKNDCTAGSYYPVTTGTDAQTQFNNTADYLKNSTYMDESIRDPKNASPYLYFLYSDTTLSTNVCPDTSSGRTQTGSRHYILRSQLEHPTDPDANKSQTACTDAISKVTISPAPASDDGYFYVCPD